MSNDNDNGNGVAIEVIGPDNWEAHVAAPISFLMLGKADCDHCTEWTTELKAFLASDEGNEFGGVTFGKMLIETPGLGKFKKANPWLAGLSGLPHNLIYVNGEQQKDWSGKGLDRLVNRLRRFTSASTDEPA